jgi:hypothetical protein
MVVVVVGRSQRMRIHERRSVGRRSLTSPDFRVQSFSKLSPRNHHSLSTSLVIPQPLSEPYRATAPVLLSPPHFLHILLSLYELLLEVVPAISYSTWESVRYNCVEPRAAI